jgi:predicted ABC-type ATPase
LRGGHDVPERIVRRRFDRSMRNFLAQYRQLADIWTLFDNSGRSPETFAFAKGDDLRIINQRVYSALVRRYGRI